MACILLEFGDIGKMDLCLRCLVGEYIVYTSELSAIVCPRYYNRFTKRNVGAITLLAKKNKMPKVYIIS